VSIPDIGDYLKKLHDVSDRKDKIQMRINSPFMLHEKIKKEETNIKSILGVLVKSFVHHQVQDHPTAVIFHIHGGGFISMSSFIHQTYTRIWANNLKVPIISVDYGKAP
jgi:acetyl esterase/lipase